MINTKILVADENLESRKSILEELKKKGYVHVYEAKDGEEALNVLASKDVDVALLDVLLPKLDGIGVIRQSKKLFDKKKVPIYIVMSILSNQHLFMEAGSVGATICMMKPLNVDSLCEHIEAILPSKNKDESLIDADLETQVTKVIHQIGVPAHIKGYQYLRTAILLTISDGNAIESVTKILYPSVAKQYQTTTSRVERAIRHAIEVAFDRGDVDVLNSYFGYTIQTSRGKPTNSEFIAMIADNMRLKNKMFLN